VVSHGQSSAISHEDQGASATTERLVGRPPPGASVTSSVRTEPPAAVIAPVSRITVPGVPTGVTRTRGAPAGTVTYADANANTKVGITGVADARSAFGAVT